MADRVSRGLLFACVVVATAALPACNSGDSAPPPTAPLPPAPPPPPAFALSFADGELEVAEGETLMFTVRYEVRELATPLEVRLADSPDSASEEDYDLSAETISVPAEEDASGEAVLNLTALGDLFFTEGSEELFLEFVPPAGVEAILGEPLRITLVDAGASPCPGVTVIGLPWHEEESLDEDVSNMLATTLSFELGSGSAGTRLEFLGPYLDLGTWGRIEESVAVFGINRWEVRTGSGAVVHELDVNWSGESWFEEEAEESLRFAFLGGACSGDPVASCTSGGCEIIP